MFIAPPERSVEASSLARARQEATRLQKLTPNMDVVLLRNEAPPGAGDWQAAYALNYAPSGWHVVPGA